MSVLSLVDLDLVSMSACGVTNIYGVHVWFSVGRINRQAPYMASFLLREISPASSCAHITAK